ncbi:hypothetical protein P4H65_24220 [Paenibacillus chitinolyticus]|uniref:hypothetical protein n=1 Tax=Paenibacillus chitinolyticus TaxID=79263 RepID=UPI002DB585DC|nr:hypothetical protein [Paenibacillus chitinolyticus]MEC0248903.1 hypothetical protein [Paenibacillus chitinolyticus]
MVLLDTIWTWVITDGWQFVVSIIAGTGAAKLFVDYSFKKRLEEDKQVLNKELERHKKELNVELESHKQALTVMTENSKFDYQRMMLDFSLYRNKKHEIYPELFKKLYVAVREFRHLNVTWDWPLDRYSKIEIEEFLSEHLFKEEEIRYVIETWDEKKDVNKIIFKMKMRELGSAQQKFSDTLEYFAASKLFVSVEIGENIIKLLGLINDLASTMPNHIIIKTTDNKIEKISSDADIESHLVEMLKILWTIERDFKKELSLGEYNGNFLKKA